ncbi:MAG: DUF1653 domain-containing protein [Bacilli bacterium]|jgi:hypothetical protein|nr:DUF1653 domain-containing protein [Bacilli bacterium]
MREIKAGQKYKHFKGTMIEVIDIAKHSETLEELVIYKHLVDGEIWARPIDMFNSLVDKEKYPDVEQEYRFEEARW